MTDFARAEHVVALTQQDTRGACANAAAPPAAEYGSRGGASQSSTSKYRTSFALVSSDQLHFLLSQNPCHALFANEQQLAR